MDTPFVSVARIVDVPPGRFVKVEAAGRAFLIAHTASGWYAVEDLCSHEDYPLSFGCLDGERIKCSLHGSRFSLETGAPVDEPADTPIATYRVEIADGAVWLDPTRSKNRP